MSTSASLLRTVAQLRRPTPNPGEVAWVLWRYTDNQHFYSFIVKPNGFELAKQDKAYRGSQRFLVVSYARRFPTGAAYRVRVRHVDEHNDGLGQRRRHRPIHGPRTTTPVGINRLSMAEDSSPIRAAGTTDDRLVRLRCLIGQTSTRRPSSEHCVTDTGSRPSRWVIGGAARTRRRRAYRNRDRSGERLGTSSRCARRTGRATWPPPSRRHLRESGLQHVVAPIRSSTSSLTVADGELSFTVYPLVEGRTGVEAGLDRRHWVSLGREIPPPTLECASCRPVGTGRDRDVPARGHRRHPPDRPRRLRSTRQRSHRRGGCGVLDRSSRRDPRGRRADRGARRTGVAAVASARRVAT